jgi:HSP20 family protein
MSKENKTTGESNHSSASDESNAVMDGATSAVQGALQNEGRQLFVRPSYRSARVEDEWEVSVVMPGVKRKDVSVSLEDDELILFGRRSDSVPDGWRPLREQHQKADFRLRLQLNFEADPERISAKLEDGVLTVRLPEHEAAKPRQIEVK